MRNGLGAGFLSWKLADGSVWEVDITVLLLTMDKCRKMPADG